MLLDKPIQRGDSGAVTVACAVHLHTALSAAPMGELPPGRPTALAYTPEAALVDLNECLPSISCLLRQHNLSACCQGLLGWCLCNICCSSTASQHLCDSHVRRPKHRSDVLVFVPWAQLSAP